MGLVKKPWETSWPWGKSFYNFQGQIYWWQGWYGCQLACIEKRQVLPGEHRTIHFIDEEFDFVVHTSTRIGFRKYTTTWALPEKDSPDYDQRVRTLREKLRKLS